MSDDIDIVDRLRIAWTSMTDMGNAEREEAADEIERLRAELASTTEKFNRLKDAAIQLRIADEEICNVRKSTREVFDRLEEAQAALDAIIGFKPPTRKNKEQR